MLVKDLIAELQECDPDAIVVMSSDGEGNSYGPLSSASCEYVYVADSTWRGEIKFAKLTPELEADGYGEEDCVAPTTKPRSPALSSGR